MRLSALVLYLLSVAAIAVESQSCYSTDLNPMRWYGTKTAYEARIKDNDTSPTITAGCKPIVIWHLNRHGSRYPDDDDILEMDNVLNDIRNRMGNSTELCQHDVTGIQNWKLRMASKDGDKLVETGKKELFDIAFRYRSRFPNIMNTSYSEANFNFRYTDKQRTRKSAEYFARGLFSSSKDYAITDPKFDQLVGNITMTTVPSQEDRLLRFYDSCEKYIKTVDDAPIVEYDKFTKSDIVSEVLRNVSQRLGLRKLLKFDELEVIYGMCAFDYGIFAIHNDVTPRDSNGAPWCAAFSRDELLVLDYLNDLEDYYEKAYGNEINYQQTCILAKDIFGWIRNATQPGKLSPKAVLRFAHSKGVTTFMTKLRLFKDPKPLMAEDFDKNANRLFRDSRNIPMASNVALAAYNCSGDYKFKVFVNEREILYPGCSETLCDFNVLSSTLGEFADTCNFDEICKYEIPQKTTVPTSSVTKMEVGFIAHVFMWLYVLVVG